MTMSITDIINGVITTEGGYTVDTGGETMFGVTAAVARKAGYRGAMRDLPRERAYSIYEDQYVNKPGFNKVYVVEPRIAAELVDTGVNCGITVPGRFLQRALNQLNKSNLVVDGKIGPATITELRNFLQKRSQTGVEVLLKMLNSMQCVRYIELCEKDDKYDPYLFGWVANRVNI